MEKLTTIQTRENLNDVYRDGVIGPGRAYHEYNVYMAGADVNGDAEPLIVIQFPASHSQAHRVGCVPAYAALPEIE